MARDPFSSRGQVLFVIELLAAELVWVAGLAVGLLAILR